MRQVRVGRNTDTAFVDDEDFDLVDQYRWTVNHLGLQTYARARTQERTASGQQKQIAMHRLIMGFPNSDVDHRDGNGLNNQRYNLRVATKAQNQQNRQNGSGGSSAYRGVSQHKNGKWRAYIWENNKQTHLGLFVTEQEAIDCRNAKAIEVWGEFANIEPYNKISDFNLTGAEP